MPFTFASTQIPGVVLITPKRFPDDRGFFEETYKASEFQKNGMLHVFVQDNHSRSVKYALRGLHYQMSPAAQGKLVQAVCGEIFDVAVDIRVGSPTFGKWVSAFLSAENGAMLWVPPGFAHGFCVLSDEADVVYKVTAEYAPQVDRGILWSDPDIGVEWPVETPVLSPKDLMHPLLRDAENNFVYGEV